MGARTSGREAALKMLFALDTAHDDVERTISSYWRELGGDPEARAYADDAVRGIAEQMTALDEIVRTASEHWRLERMTRVDRNVLRLGAWELKNRLDVPRAVILDEAVELAKSFGSEESGAFVNGVLDQIAQHMGRLDTDREP